MLESRKAEFRYHISQIVFTSKSTHKVQLSYHKKSYFPENLYTKDCTNNGSIWSEHRIGHLEMKSLC